MTDNLQTSPHNEAVVASNGSVTNAPQVPVLEVDNLTKSYPGEPPVHALRQVNLAIGQGESCAQERSADDDEFSVHFRL